MTIPEIRTLLESPYNQKEWKVFLQTHFTNGKLFGDAHVIELTDKTISKKCYSLGNYEVDEYTKIGIFEVQLNDNVKLTRNRVGLRNLIKNITQQVAGAMVVFVQGDKWRFSYVSKRKVKNKETNTIENKETAPKRYTYLFGKNEKALTAAIRFDKLIQKQRGNLYQYLTLHDFEEAFSVEKLSKDFFNEYKKSYEDFVEFLTGKRYTKKGTKYVEQVMHGPDLQLTKLFKSKDKEKEARDFVKRMMGRIVFLYFIQKKGWMAVPQGKTWGDGNHDYLFDLFKNSKHKNDFYTKELIPLFFKTLNDVNSESESNKSRFPYLNGGLFDDSQDKIYNDLKLPEVIFNSLFDTFNNFNFTIYEDAPDEHTVAVDPEMLGHIFENLLEDNKEKGAFYTPKEIVHYMCQESLAEHLASKFDNTHKEIILKLIQQVDLDEQQETWAKQNATEIILALEKIKICDPAIGSGAFPMGLLQEIFNLMVVLHDYKGWGKKNEVEIKKHIIQESIYGVDLDAGAVDIARLRFWLSLVVDEEKPQPLPNLDYKIVKGNSLIGFPENWKSPAFDKIEKLKDKFFNSTSSDKSAIKEEIDSEINKALTSSEKVFGYQIDFDFKLFFSEVFHGNNYGFDIVIGNPPYGHTVKENKKYFKTNFISTEGKHEIFKYFIERGLKLVKPNGVLSYITSDTWTSLGYFKKLRKLIYENYRLVAISKTLFNVFETATVDTNIYFIQNSVPLSPYKYLLIEGDLNSKKEVVLEKTEDFVFNLKDKNLLVTTIENDKIPLNKFCEIWQGLIAYGKKTQPREFTSDSMVTTFHRKLLYGGDISKYTIHWSGEYLKYGEWLHRPRPSYIFDNAKILVQRIRNPKLKTRLVCALDESGYINGTGLSNVLLKKGVNNISLKYLLSILNSKLINYWFSYYFIDVNIKPEQLRKLPIKVADKMGVFESLIDYITYLTDDTNQIVFSHTINSRIASHIEEILNMMVNELYFEKHMKEVGIDVLKFINPKPIADLKTCKEKENVIKDFYLWLQTPVTQLDSVLIL